VLAHAQVHLVARGRLRELGGDPIRSGSDADQSLLRAAEGHVDTAQDRMRKEALVNNTEYGGSTWCQQSAEGARPGGFMYAPVPCTSEKMEL
jgi:hypothetical protein